MVCSKKSKPFKLMCPIIKGKFHLQKLNEIEFLRLRLNFYTGKGRMNWHKDDYNFAWGPQFAEPHCWKETVLRSFWGTQSGCRELGLDGFCVKCFFCGISNKKKWNKMNINHSFFQNRVCFFFSCSPPQTRPKKTEESEIKTADGSIGVTPSISLGFINTRFKIATLEDWKRGSVGIPLNIAI